MFKSGDRSSIWNYRLYYNFFPKIYERFIYNHVVKFININNIIHKYQFGLRQKHYIQQAIITLIKKNISCID